MYHNYASLELQREGVTIANVYDYFTRHLLQHTSNTEFHCKAPMRTPLIIIWFSSQEYSGHLNLKATYQKLATVSSKSMYLLNSVSQLDG